VHHTTAPRIEINRYHGVKVTADRLQLPSADGALTKVDLNSWEEVDEVIAYYGRTAFTSGNGDGPQLHALPLKELSSEGPGRDLTPILYKFRGSQDVKGSCALSVDQLLDYTRLLFRQNMVPAQITEILSTSPVLLLGYGFFDPDFRLIYHGLLRSALELRRDPVYSVQVPPERVQNDPYRKMELQLWDRVKEAALRLGITTLDSSSEDFLEALLGSLSRVQTA
jgi:hypothetical protein